MLNFKLTQRYILALFLIATCVTLTYITSINVIQSNNDYAKIINISGKQRMLSQRLVILAYAYNSTPSKNNKLELFNALKEIENMHMMLSQITYTPIIKNMYDNYLNPKLEKYLDNFHNILIHNDIKYANLAKEKSKEILILLDRIVKEYENHASNELKMLSSYESFILIITLIVILFEALFIFRPATKQIQKHQEDLIKLNESLEKKVKKRTSELEKQKEKFEVIFKYAKDSISIHDLNGKFLYFNEACQEMFDLKYEELISQSLLTLCSKDENIHIQKVLTQTIKKGSNRDVETTFINKKQKRIKVNMSLAYLPSKNKLLIVSRDISIKKQIEKQINDYVKLIDENIITSTTDINGKIIYVSQKFCEISGYSENELLNSTHKIIRHEDMSDELYINIREKLIKNQIWCGEIKNKKKNGDFYWVYASISPIFNEIGEKEGYTAIRQDITDKKALEEISKTDGLTNIFNRRYFNEIFPKVINSAKRDNSLISFLILDVDFFKQYNDTYGHQMGDEVLIKISKTLDDSLNRADDYCFRLGGEEFGALFKTDSKEKAKSFVNNIRLNIENLNIEHNGNSVSNYVTVSIGLVCLYANDIYNTNELYKLADDLLYKAKENGRNRVVVL